jgi:hypothetical protein
MSWRELEAGAPALAANGRGAFDRTHVALLGTIRADGTPRISPVEPYFLGGELVFGAMTSPKLEDLRRDSRCVLHSSVSDVNGTDGEFKLYGRGTATDDPAITAADRAWWASRPQGSFEVFILEVFEAVLVAWDLESGSMRTVRWHPGATPREATRPYP